MLPLFCNRLGLRTQYHDLLYLAASISAFQEQEALDKLRPTQSAVDNPRDWWQYLVCSLPWVAVERATCSHERDSSTQAQCVLKPNRRTFWKRQDQLQFMGLYLRHEYATKYPGTDRAAEWEDGVDAGNSPWLAWARRFKDLTHIMQDGDDEVAAEAAATRSRMLSASVRVGSLPPLRPHEQRRMALLQRRMDVDTVLRAYSAVALILRVRRCGG